MADFSWTAPRGAGVFLHISSLPSEYGVGNIGSATDCFFDFLNSVGFRYWQICPLNPTGFGDSPYQSFSAFAGNIYYIDYSLLAKNGLLEEGDLVPLKSLPKHKCDFGALYHIVPHLLRTAYGRFAEIASRKDNANFLAFCKKQAHWLDSYSLFMALKTHFEGASWDRWPAEFRDYTKARKAKLPENILLEIEIVKFGQWIFFSQYADFKKRAKKAEVEIFGDLPIFLAYDSADVWANPELFDLKKDGSPANVAGVAPDYFSETGQLWGNPLYDWKGAKKKVFEFWFKRIEAALEMFDVIRFDHFRGFADYWAIPASATDARAGKTKKGPGLEFFEALRKKFPKSRFVAEDLGLLSKAAFKLRDDIKIPAMAVLQFAFGGGPENPYLPHNIRKDCVYYTGTHDNNTACGWYSSASEKEKDQFRRYFRASGECANWDMIHGVMMSVAQMAVFPMQDIVGLGSECRTNTPGAAFGNWQWRLLGEQLENVSRVNAPYLKSLADLSGRFSAPKNVVEILANQSDTNK